MPEIFACIETDMLITWGSATQKPCQVLTVKV